MNVLIIGGMAGGAVLELRDDARDISLKQKVRPKIMLDATASMEFETVGDDYEVHRIEVFNRGERKGNLFAVGVVKGQTLVWGMQQLMIAYQEKINLEKVQH